MIQMTLIQIDNYGPWTVTPKPRTESDLQILQAELFADVQRLIAAKKGLVFFTRFDNMLAITNGLDKEDHLRIQRSIRNRYPITISMGVGAALQDKKKLETAADELTQIAGQKAVKTKAKKSIAGFKLREGAEIGCMVTLRGDRMYEFLDRLINVSLPRVKDFRGVRATGFDGRGNFSMGIKEHIIFPEVNFEKIDDIKGTKFNIEWGSQIRSYVFMPYTLAKDARTSYEDGNIQAVMDGEIDGFINAYLKMNAKS